MRVDSSWVAAAALLLIAASHPSGLQAQSAGTIGLDRILHGLHPGTSPSNGGQRPPDEFLAHRRGGYFKTVVKRWNDYTEAGTVSWTFDRDINTLRAGDKIKVTLRMDFPKTGSDETDPNKFYGFSNYQLSLGQNANAVSSFISRARKQGQLPADSKSWASNIIEGLGSFYARKDGVPHQAERELVLEVSQPVTGGGKYSAFFIKFAAYPFRGEPEDRPDYDVAYVFRSDSAGTNPIVKIGDVEVPDLGPVSTVSANPRDQPGAQPGNVDTPGGSPNDGPNTGRPGGPGQTGRDGPDGRGQPQLPPDTPFRQLPPPAGGDSTASGQLTLATVERVVPVGGTIQIPVYLRNADDVANVNFELAYVDEVVRAAGDPFRGNILPANSLFAGNSNQAGVVLAGFAGTAGAAGTGTVAEVRFRAVGRVGQSTPLTLKVTRIDNPSGEQLPIALVHGRITIADEDGVLRGDCNGDNRIDWRDAMCPLLMSVKKLPEQSSMDIDRDGSVDSRDSVLILQQSLGLGGTTP